MPDPVTHYVFGSQVVSELPDEIREKIRNPVFERALQGPDSWSVIGFYGGPGKRCARRGGVMHQTRTGAFLSALARQAMEAPSEDVFSFLAGMICHYCLDRKTHPFIIYMAHCCGEIQKTGGRNGGHTRMEHAIDSHYIRQLYGKAPWHISIPARLMKLKRYPESLRRPLDQAFHQVYGWEAVFDSLNASLRDERLFYRLMQDPLGIARWILKPVSGGNINYSVYSYWHSDIDGRKADYLNLQHRPWHHPLDPSNVSRDSFFDLFGNAKEEALEMLCKIHSVIYHGDSFPAEEIFGNRSYSTGFDCDDPRNRMTPDCRPLASVDGNENLQKENRNDERAI